MTTYDKGFASKFAELAETTVAGGLDSVETRRVVAYISRVSMELSLKALLEHVGVPVNDIRKRSHDLRALLAEVDKCEVEVEIMPGVQQWVPASRLRAVSINFLTFSVPLGIVVEAEDHGASVYPNEIRYGEVPKDFPPEALARTASVLADWLSEHWDAVRKQ